MYSRACSQLLLGRGDWTLNRSMDNITEAGSILSHDASTCRFTTESISQSTCPASWAINPYR
jgi:hypothetical protein